MINDVLRSEGWVSPLGGAEWTNNAFPPGINYFDRCLNGRLGAKVAGVAESRFARGGCAVRRDCNDDSPKVVGPCLLVLNG